MDTLKLSKPYMHGSAVRRLQEMLISLGYGVGEIDGIFGPATKNGVERFQTAAEIKIDGICGPKTWAALIKAADEYSRLSPPMFGRDVDGPIIDIRDTHKNPRLFRGFRSWDEIDGVTLHQCGVRMGKEPRSWRRLNAHIGVLHSGKVVIVNDPSMLIYHAQGLSPTTIGIEIDGNFPGLMDKPNTLWKGGGGPHSLNADMIAGLDRLFDWLLAEFTKNGAIWKHVFGHRQSANSRIADPGEQIWKTIALKWIRELDAVEPGVGFCLGTGRPLPREWTGKETSPKYWSDPPRKK